MKRLTTFLLLLSLFLSGCGNELKEPVTFYYLSENFEEDMSSAIASEQREASGHRDDLKYLMALYLMGPAGEDLRTPLPKDTKILSMELHGTSVTITISDISDAMTDAQFTLACSCLTLTCLDISDATNVTIICGERNITMDADDLLLHDLITAKTEDSQ